MPENALFLGEGPRSAGYLEGVLQTAYALERVYANQPLGDRALDYPLFILSDYPSHQLGAEQQERLVRLVERDGAGLLMIGGWASFAGPRGSYHGTRLSELLPVELLGEDDRTNTPLGTVLVVRREPHPAVATVQRSRQYCVVCGYNRVLPRPEAQVLVHGYALHVAPGSIPRYGITATSGGRVALRELPSRTAAPAPRLSRLASPMLSVWEWGRGRVAAFAPDVSPHWAGGIVDWGAERLSLPNGAEVGHLYRDFLLDLCTWLRGAS
jgi:uncharacterized membrane protein